MGIILRYILLNIREKKLRSILIIVSITLSAALFFGTSGMSTTIQKMYLSRVRQYIGSAEIFMFAGNSETAFFSPRLPEEFVPRVTYAVGSIRSDARFETEDEIVEVPLHGFDFDDLQMMNPVTLVEGSAGKGFSGKMAIIGLHTAERYNLEVGDALLLKIQEVNHRFRVAGIAQSKGFLTNDGSSHAMIVPLSTLASLFDARGRVSMVYVKARYPEDSPQLYNEMLAGMKRHQVYETINREEMRLWAQDTVVPFRIMLMLTLAISIFIIYTCFQVITMERLPVVGTFRSVGASRRATCAMLVVESLFYGILGGVLGGAFGILVMYFMTHLNTGGWLQQTGITLHFTSGQLLQSFFLAVLLAVGSAFLPILRVARYPVKDVILNRIAHSKGKPLLRIILGVVFLIPGIGIPFLFPGILSIVVVAACILLILIAVVMLVPLITKMVAAVLNIFFQLFFGNIGALAIKNLRENKNILHNVALLAIGISSLYMISTVSSSVMNSLGNLYRNSKYEIQMWAWPMNRTLDLATRTVPGVTGTYGIMGAWNVKLPRRNDEIGFVHGIDKDKYPEYWEIDTPGDPEALFEKLDSGRYLIASFTLQRRLDLTKGDLILLDFGKRQKEYEVAGFFSTINYNGDYALIGERFLKLDSGERYYSGFYIKATGDPEEVATAIREKFARRRPWVSTTAEMEQSDRKSNAEMFLVLQGFSIMTLLIGIIGVLNNYLLSFMERRKSLALLRSVGMSRKQAIVMFFIEALSGGLVGALAGLAAGSMMLFIVPQLFVVMRLPVIIFRSGAAGVLLMIAGIAVSLVASVFPAAKTSKLNIIQAIRYE